MKVESNAFDLAAIEWVLEGGQKTDESGQNRVISLLLIQNMSSNHSNNSA